jgi:hypothetical protein
LRSSTAAERAGTKSIALLYLSAWRNAASAQAFARLYTRELGRKYSGLKADMAAQNTAPGTGGEVEQAFSTDEGPVVITTRGKLVFVSESFPLNLARKLSELILDAQGTGAMQMAAVRRSSNLRGAGTNSSGQDSLSGGLVRFFSDCGVMKVAVDAGLKAVR